MVTRLHRGKLFYRFGAELWKKRPHLGMKAVLFKHYESPAHTAASNSRLSSYTLDFTQHIYTSAFNRIHV